MINALRYEPQGQRQRFEPREQQGSDTGQRHMHLHVHVQLTLGARRAHRRRFLQPTTARVTAIFAAWIFALSMALSFTVMSSTSFPFVGPHIALAGQIMFIGALIGSSAVFFGGLPLVVETWRANPRSRLLLMSPLLALLTLLSLVQFLTVFGVVNVPLLLTELLIVAAVWCPTWRKRSFFALLSLFILTMPFIPLLLHAIRLPLILLLGSCVRGIPTAPKTLVGPSLRGVMPKKHPSPNMTLKFVGSGGLIGTRLRQIINPV
jgi:hypothetical protein